MSEEFKIKAVVEGEVDEKQLEETGKKAGDIVGKSIEKQKVRLTVEKGELEQDLKTVKKTIEEMTKNGERGKIYFQAQLEKEEFELRLKEIDKELNDLSEKTKKGFDINAMGHLLNSGIFEKIGDGVMSLGKKILSLGDSAQQAQISFTTMLGSADDAKDLIKDLSDFASKTPFELSGIRDSAKQLLAMGVNAKDMIPTLKALGDVSAGLNVPLERLALNYGQVLTQGKLTGKELKDFTTAGVPLIDELAKNLGKTKTEIQDMVSQGQISADDMVEAFESMTSAGGRFADLMEAQSQTLGGLLSNLNDEINLTGEAIGEQLVPTASTLVGILGDVAGKVREWVEEHPKLTTALVTFVGVVGGLIALGGTLAGVVALLTTAFGAVALPVLGVVAALGALSAIGVVVYNNFQEIAEKNEFAGETYESLTEKIKENEEALADLDEQLKNGEISLEEYTDKKKELEEQEGKLKGALDRTYMSLNDVKGAIDSISNSNISNTQKLKRLQELKAKAFETKKSIDDLRASLESIGWEAEGIRNNRAGKLSWSGLGAYLKMNWKDTWSMFGLSSENGAQYEERILQEEAYLKERIDNYDEYAKEEEKLDKAIAETELEIEKDKEKEKDKIKGGGSGGSKKNNEVEEKKKELKEKRDLMIKEVQESEMSEEEKYKKMLEISEWYKDELSKLKGEETDNAIKNAEKELKAIDDKNKKEVKYYEDVMKVGDKARDSVEKYKKEVEKVGEEWDKVKKKAEEALRQNNNSIKELDDEFEKSLIERYNKNKEDMKKMMSSDEGIGIAKDYSLQELLDTDWTEINGIRVDRLIEFKKLLEDQEILEGRLTDEQKEQAKWLEKATETEKMLMEYEEKRAVLVEKSKMLEAIKNGTLEDAGVRYKDESKEIIQYFDKEKDEWIDIQDFKNSEYARDILDNQATLQTKLEDLEKAHQSELEEYGKQVMEIKKKYEEDTTNYKKQLDEKKKAFAEYVEEINRLASSISSKAQSNAYGGSLLEGNVSWVGENGPEQIIARQSSYVQPRNAVNNSTVYNNQSSLSINGLEIGSMNSIDDLLEELRNRLTYRN